MGTLFTGATIIGLLLLIVGGIGFFHTYTSFALGNPHWIQEYKEEYDLKPSLIKLGEMLGMDVKKSLPRE